MKPDKCMTDEALWAKWSARVPENLRSQDGIKAQFAASAAVIRYLNEENPQAGWDFVPTEVGGWEDRVIGVDGYLVCQSKGVAYAVDFSLESDRNPKGNKANSRYLVHLDRDWFEPRNDGIWVLRKTYLKALVRSFVDTLRNPPISWKPQSVHSGLCRS